MNLSYESLKALLRLYLKLTNSKCQSGGRLPIPPGPRILAANHTYIADIFHLPFVVPGQLHFLMQGSLFANPISAFVLAQAGQIEVHRDRRGQSFETALRLLAQGETIVIYPEGRLTPPGTRHPGRTGAVRLAQASGAPIIPLGTHISSHHVKEVRFRLHNRERSGLFQLGGTCRLNFGEPWHPEEGNIHTLTDELMDRIYALVEQTPKESPCASPISPNPIRPWSAAHPSSHSASPKG